MRNNANRFSHKFTLGKKCEICNKPLRNMSRSTRCLKHLKVGVPLSEKAFAAVRRGSEAHAWKGGRCESSSGYIMLLDRSHPCCNTKGYVYEHRVVVERIIGRHLVTAEAVHHVDGNKQHNHPSNLMCFRTNADHNRFEHGRPLTPGAIIFDGRTYHE